MSVSWREVGLLRICIVVLIIVWLGVAVRSCILVERERDPRGKAILSRQYWPERLLELIHVANQKGIPVDHLQVYHGFRDDFYWKCDATQELIDLMTLRWKLTVVSSNYRAVRIALECMPTALLSLNQGKDTEYYVSAEYLPGGEWKGDLYCVMNDKANKIIIVRYYYNF